MRKFVIALVLLHITPLVAQRIDLPGVVVVQNSEYETGHRRYVSDASVRAPLAKAVTSDKEGRFALVFAGVENGTPVRITVEKPGMEVVNNKEIEEVILGRAPQFKVVMADAKKLAEARMNFYNVATGSITRSFERKMILLRDSSVKLEARMAAINRELEDTLGTIGQAMEAIAHQRDQALARSQDLAHEFASVDLDDASARYRQAYAFFSRGEIDSTLSVLDADRLGADYRNAIAEKGRGLALMEKANQSIRQLLQSYRLKADVQETRLQYAASIATRERMLAIMTRERDAIDALDGIKALHDLVLLEEIVLRLDSGVAHARRGLDLATASLPSGHPEIAGLHADLGILYTLMSRYDEAMKEEDMALALQLA